MTPKHFAAWRCTVMLCFALGLVLGGAGFSAAQTQTAADIRDQVFVAAQRVTGSLAAQAMAASAARIAADTPELAQLVRDRQDKADELQRLRTARTALSLRSGTQAEDQTARLDQETAAIEADLAALNARLASTFPDFATLVAPRPVSRADVQATLRPEEALVFFLVGESETFVWAISPDQAVWHRLPVSDDDLVAKVTELLSTVRGGTDLRGAAPLDGQTRDLGYDLALAHQLYTDLLAPVEPVLAQARHVMVVPDGALTSMPLAMLVSSPEAQDLTQADWLIRRHALTTLPSVASLLLLRKNGPDLAGPRRPFVGFGDPLLGYQLAAQADTTPDGAVTRGVYEDVRRVAELSPLPATAEELRALAALTGASPEDIFLKAAATEAQVKSADLSSVDILAFATHGLLGGALPGLSEPALVFSPPLMPSLQDDALLTASEAAMLRLSAQLVILSACDTAGSNGQPGGEGLSGLARAFLYAGAKAILVSHWPVDDRAASRLTTGMISATRSEGMTRADGLRTSMLALADSPATAHPRFWAPFVVVGEGGADSLP